MRLPLKLSCTNACRTGKTQICHTLCVTTQMPHEMGGGAGKVSQLLAVTGVLRQTT